MPESARLKDIAEPLGVSEVSVSNALSGKKGVSDKLRSLILDKARELDFDLSRYDRKKNNSPMVGVIISKRYADQNNSFYRGLYQQLILEAAKEGVLVVPEIVCDEGEQAASESARVEENQAASESARRKETDAAHDVCSEAGRAFSCRRDAGQVYPPSDRAGQYAGGSFGLLQPVAWV